MARGRGAGGQRRADGELQARVARCQLISEKGDLGFGPNPDEADAGRLLCQRSEQGRKRRSHKVIQVQRFDDRHFFLGRGRRKGKLRARGLSQAVRAELLEVRSLGGIRKSVPVADVNDAQALIRLKVGPLHHPLHRSGPRSLTHEAPRFLMAYVQQVRQWLVAADGLHEVILQALCYKKGRRHEGVST